MDVKAFLEGKDGLSDKRTKNEELVEMPREISDVNLENHSLELGDKYQMLKSDYRRLREWAVSNNHDEIVELAESAMNEIRPIGRGILSDISQHNDRIYQILREKGFTS